VNTSTPPKVGYSYADGSQGTIRPTQLVYPNGRILTYGYNSGPDDIANRVSFLADTSPLPPGEGQGEGLNQQLVNYQYLGLSSILDLTYPQPGIRGTYDVDPSAPGTYPGLDQFGRVVDLLWQNTATGAALERVQHGYDRAGNRLWRQCPVATAAGQNFDELYSYDGVNQLRSFQRGSLAGGQTAIASGSENFAQQWTLDATGNWAQFQEDDTGSGTWSLDQTRTHDTANEIASFAAIAGAVWAQPAYDRNGSMISLPQPASQSASFTCTYDAWNRLVKVVDASTSYTVAEYQYDGRGFRVLKDVYTSGAASETRHFYYNGAWQVLEERVGTFTAANRHYVWGVRYIDDLVLRDRDTTGDGALDERLFAVQEPNWSVTAIADPSGSVVERYCYSPYGEPTFLTGVFAGRISSIYEMNILFCGYLWDAIAGSFLARRRRFWFHLGRWGHRDPIGYDGGVNLYEYVGGSPLTRTDPKGIQPPPTNTQGYHYDPFNFDAILSRYSTYPTDPASYPPVSRGSNSTPPQGGGPSIGPCKPSPKPGTLKWARWIQAIQDNNGYVNSYDAMNARYINDNIGIGEGIAERMLGTYATPIGAGVNAIPAALSGATPGPVTIQAPPPAGSPAAH